MSRFSDYIIYLNESGEQPTPNDSLFILSACIFDKKHYSEKLVPRLQALKFQYFGHDGVLLSADDGLGPSLRHQFQADFSALLDSVNFILISCVYDRMLTNDKDLKIPRDEMLRFSLDHASRFLQEREQTDRLTNVIAVGSDPDQNEQAVQAFRQVCAQKKGQDLPFSLQITELYHQPLGNQFVNGLFSSIRMYYQSPEKENAVFERLKTKFYCRDGRKNVGHDYEGWGYKVFNNE